MKKINELNVLVVDDSKTICRINKMIVTQMGVNNCDTAEDGSVGLKLFMKNDYDLVLSDINMPVMNGFEFVAEIRKRKSKDECPVFMITTEGGKQEVLRALKLGANNYLVKPLDKDNLIQKIEDLYQA